MKLGQKVWFTGGNPHGEGLTEGEIIKIGRKYIYVKGPYPYDLRYCKETHREARDVGWRGQLYLDQQEYLDKVELNANTTKITKTLREYDFKFSLEQSREILSILGLEGETE